MVARGSGMHHFTDESLLGAPLAAAVDMSRVSSGIERAAQPAGLSGADRDRQRSGGAFAAGASLPCHVQARRHRAVYRRRSTVEIREPELCPRYMCGLVRGVKVAPSPPWLKARLLLAGMRPINNVVDITNYVLYEWGQPLHAFDFQKIAGSKIVVRRMAEGETLELLSGAVVGARGQTGGKPFSAAAAGHRRCRASGGPGGHHGRTFCRDRRRRPPRSWSKRLTSTRS